MFKKGQKNYDDRISSSNVLDSGVRLTFFLRKRNVIRSGFLGIQSHISMNLMMKYFPSFFRDIFHYLDEETQDAVFYQEEESFDSLDVLSRKIETEIKTLYGQKCKASGSPPTILVNLFETSLNVANHLMALSDNEPYGVRGARIILNFRNLNGVEETIGSFMVDPNTVSLDFANCPQ